MFCSYNGQVEIVFQHIMKYDNAFKTIGRFYISQESCFQYNLRISDSPSNYCERSKLKTWKTNLFQVDGDVDLVVLHASAKRGALPPARRPVDHVLCRVAQIGHRSIAHTATLAALFEKKCEISSNNQHRKYYLIVYQIYDLLNSKYRIQKNYRDVLHPLKKTTSRMFSQQNCEIQGEFLSIKEIPMLFKI